MNKKLYVGNLPYDTDEDAIRELFSPYGDVASVDMINDRDTGRFRGFAFVAMEAEAADEAAKALNGYSMGGRPLTLAVTTADLRPWMAELRAAMIDW